MLQLYRTRFTWPRPAARFWALLGFLLLAFSYQTFAFDLTVAKDGTGNYTTVQAAIDAAPTGRTAPFTIYIKNGRYKELVTVPANKPFIQLIGESVGSTVITYNNSAGTIVGGVALGTQNSASVTINATDFSAMNLTFENSFGESASNGQAVAILVNNDRAAFRNCRFLGNQDTMYLKGNGTPRQYFLNCYVEGNTDFIFGSAIALFENCNIYAKNKATASVSYIAVPNTPAGQAYGLVFKNCNVTGHSVAGGTTYDLGRPWQANPKAAFLNCNLNTPLILAEGWSPTSSAGTATIRDSYFVEYQNTHFNGRPINVSSRVLSGQALTPAQPSSQLTAAEAATYTKANILGTWDPCSLIDCVTPFVKSVVVNNFRGVKGATASAFTWNTSWPISGDVLSVYRATATPPTPLGAFAVVNSQTEPNDTTFNYSYSDAVPASGSLYKYFVRGSNAVRQISSDTVTISSAPTIVTTGALGNFTQQLGTGSPAQSISVSGTDLTSAVTVTASANYQVSLTSGGTFASSVTLTPTAGTLASTPVYIRLNATTAGPYTGTVTLTSTNATNVVVSLNGTAIVAPTITSNVVQWWPLRVNNSDSVQVRSSRLTATTPTLRRLYLSNGTTLATIPAYSNQFGQAFGASATGDGQWSTAAGGPGGTLSRLYYEQFTVSVAAGAPTMRIDSVLFNSAFYNTSSNTKMAIVYSLNGFSSPADSTEITGVSGPGGAQPLTASGSFNSSFPLLNQTSGNTNLYRVALKGPSTANPSGGVTVAAGQTLTVRLYYACGSTGVPRYALLKNLRFKGDVAPLPVTVLEQWPLRVNNTDSAQVRSSRIVATTPTLRRLYLSNGTTLATIPAYSNQFGQAFGASAAGDGQWSTAAGGPGGTLSRIYYEQFTLAVAPSSAVRVDTLLFNAAFYNTSSNTKMAVVYSLNGFGSPADSTEIVAAYGPGGLQALSASGNFNNSFPLLNQTAGNPNTYRVVLRNGGVSLAGGQTLSVRLYFACGSTGVPRYALLKNVRFKGTAGVVTGTTPAQRLSAQLQLFPNPASGSFWVQLPALGSKAAVSAALINTLGQTVRTQQLKTAAGQPIEAEVDVRGLAAGVYTLRLNVGGTPVTRKVVVE
ncbi:T9SS type A sorting domain-containing protein [Hymenobacter sp. BT523]|uniref:pectinesterase family protein n=1 Tax=Hymenobacter sp. BT523 TaxID=2795725 RepID=UPI0018EC0219|nr:pectinesterase family protein [Hymenobacter sp. BT523]MBJ6110526.1 T9SS type A sorting domain-containing protein [Hymenobacter sp. BT523]